MALDTAAPAPTESADPAAPAGYSIEIEVASDGSITVSCESEGDENAEGQGSPEDESKATPVKSIKEAVAMALSIYANNGEMPENDTSDAEFDGGFGKKAAAPKDKMYNEDA